MIQGERGHEGKVCAKLGHFSFVPAGLRRSAPAHADRERLGRCPARHPEQRRACTPDVYRLCAGEIPNVRAITACLRRQKASLSPACAAVFPQ
jgi:hypothetical protein